MCAHLNQALKVRCAFGFCVINCGLWCQFAKKKVKEVGEEKEVVKKNSIITGKCKTAVNDLGRRYTC